MREADEVALLALPGVAAVEREERGYVIRLDEGAEIAHLMGRITERVAPRRLELARPTLEEVFFELVGAER
jgi:ABC-2 type transport system ATP-binding protein